MSWLGGSSFGKAPDKVVVIGLDGVPFSYLDELIRKGEVPNVAKLVTRGSMVRADSVLPALSGVAWASFMTGKNPGKHGIYGFLDRSPHSYDTYIPSSTTMRSDTLWELLTRAGKRVVVMNVPMTYPPRQVNGIMVAGFLSPSLEGSTYPSWVAGKLKDMGYIIDIDPWVARESKGKFLEDLRHALKRRAEALFYFLENEKWDFFMMHIMETDRLHHFLWEDMERGSQYAQEFIHFYKLIDEILGQVYEKVKDQATLIVMSDHGFCTLKKEVYLNHWLAENGWLKFKTASPQTLADIHPDSKAYSLYPGRIYVNLRGREPSGGVEPGKEYEAVRGQLVRGLLELRDPETGEGIVEKVLKREELYGGPCYHSAPDLVVTARDSYDLKGSFDKDVLTHRGAVVGMHTFHDAMLYINGQSIVQERPRVVDVMPTILDLMGVSKPADLDGVSLI